MPSISRVIRITALCVIGSTAGPALLSAQQVEASAAGTSVATPAPTSVATPAPRPSPLFERNASEAPTLAAAEEANTAANRADNTISMSTVTLLLVILLLVVLL